MEGAQLDLYLSLDDGWTPRWKQPMVAVTCVLSFLFSLMLFLVLVNRRQHMRLLHAMIPKKVRGCGGPSRGVPVCRPVPLGGLCACPSPREGEGTVGIDPEKY